MGLYSYGFQGQEKDDEISGTGDAVNFKFRMYDPRLGRFKSTDPLEASFAWNSPFAFSENRVIDGVELEGMEYIHYHFKLPNGSTLIGTVYAGFIKKGQILMIGGNLSVSAAMSSSYRKSTSYSELFWDEKRFKDISLNITLTDGYFWFSDFNGNITSDQFELKNKIIYDKNATIRVDQYVNQNANEVAAEFILLELGGEAVGRLLGAVFKAAIPKKFQTGVKNVSKSAGEMRADKYAEGWEGASLNEAIEKFAPGSKGVKTSTGKTVYKNSDTGIQVVYDDAGNYFRIENTNLGGKRRYLDLEGNIPNNKVVDGKTSGRSQAEYNQSTHFNNTDKKE